MNKPASLNTLFKRFSQMRVFVVGDAMLDCYWYGRAERISPEAPVPVVEVAHKENRPGGAANVALNCAALGAKVSLFTVIGKDEAGTQLCKSLQAANIDTANCLRSEKRRTTTKTRVLARNQQLLRLDEEQHSPLETADEHRLIDTCLRAIQIEVPNILIFEDYNKGVLKKNVIDRIIEHCRMLGVQTAVDPKKENFLAYRGVDLFKPNLKEVREALGLSNLSPTLPQLQEVHQLLHRHLQHRTTFITLSEYGIFAQEQGKKAHWVQAHRRSIADVSGAGDTVIAVSAMGMAAGLDTLQMTELANLAGGLVCEEVGVIPIDRKKLGNEARTVRNLGLK